MRFRSDPANTIRGSIAPVVTPFTADGKLDLEGLRALVRWQLASGSHGISLGGSTGEPSAQTVRERIAAMDAAAEEISDQVPFVPGTGSAMLDETLELTARARDIGADAVLVITPYYARPTQDGLFAWYDTVAWEYPDLPVLIYNVPPRTAVDIAPETVATMYDSWQSGDHNTARDLHYALHPLVDLIFTETNPAPAKWVLHEAGLLGSAHVRPPLPPLSDAAQHKIKTLLQAGEPALHPPMADLAKQD